MWKRLAIRRRSKPRKFYNFQFFPARDFFTLSEYLMPPPANTPKLFFWTLNSLLGIAFIVEILAPRFSPDLFLRFAAVFVESVGIVGGGH